MMMKLLFAYGFLVAALHANCAFAQKEYLDEVFAIVERNSIKRDSVDFSRIKKDAYGQLEGIKSLQDCYPIVRSILTNLNDHHSFFMEKSQVDQWKTTSKRDGVKVTEAFSGRVMNNDIGYIMLYGFSSGDSIFIKAYANEMQSLIKLIDNPKIKGWVIDIRSNTGGNCWPMLAGLGPILGDGTCGFFVGVDGTKSPWYYKKGASGSMADLCRVDSPYNLIGKNLPVAVLTGSRTASSGEVVAASFRGKLNAKSFGQNTAGLSTGNANFLLSDGSMIFLTSSVYANRLGELYGREIAPDVVVAFDYNADLKMDSDPVITAATRWIYEHK